MAGSIVNPKRPRYQSNERFDTSDADAQSRAPREQAKASMRAAHSTPRATAGSPSTIGLICTGFELTLNPTGSTDGKVRVGTNVGVAVDSDGGLLIKPQGVTLDLAIPVGTYQIYAYYSEVTTDNARRRFLSVTSPFVETSGAMDTAYQGQVSLVALPGVAGSVVPEAVVNGVTTALCCIGIATNGGTGTITMTGYNATTAPNGTDIVNRLTVPAAPSVAPTTPFVNGSIKTFTDMMQALAYMIGQAVWKGSAISPPTSANNFQAWTQHSSSIAQLSEYLTAGLFHGASQFDSTLQVAGLLTALAGVAVTGSLTAHDNVTLGDTGADGLTVNATSVFTGGATFNNVDVTSGSSLHLNGTAALVADGNVTLGNASGDALTVNATATFLALLTASLGITIPSGQNLTLTNTADLKHGARVITLHASSFRPGSLSTTLKMEGSGGIPGTAWSGWGVQPNNTIVSPIPLRVGDRILSYKWFFFKASNASAMSISISTFAGSAPRGAAPGGTDTEATVGTGTTQNRTLSSINYTLIAGEQINMQVTAQVSGQEFYSVEITYDHP